MRSDLNLGILFFAACFPPWSQKECENLASHSKRNIFLFWIALAHPQSAWKHAFRRSSKCPAAWHRAKTSGVGGVLLALVSVSPIWCWGVDSCKRLKSLRRGPGETVVHLAARWPKFSSLSQGQAAHKDDKVDSCTVQRAVQKEHAGMITQLIEKCTSHLSGKNAKHSMVMASQFSNVSDFWSDKKKEIEDVTLSSGNLYWSFFTILSRLNKRWLSVSQYCHFHIS